MSWTLECDDIRRWCEMYSGPKFHGLLCDPPYHLTDMTRARPDRQGKVTPFLRQQARTGFMGTTWDGGDVAFRPQTWQMLAVHLLPGAFGFAFASSRGWHRLACAIEDAGLILHPSVFCWNTSQGFPKATKIDDPRFHGHRYGLQSMKPSVEPIILFQKLYQGEPQNSIRRTGAGALNIEAGRIGEHVHFNEKAANKLGRSHAFGVMPNPHDYEGTEAIGRWPANFAIQHLITCKPLGSMATRSTSPGKGGGTGGLWKPSADGKPISDGHSDADGNEQVQVYACAPGCPVAEMAAQTGTKGEVGTASRFFFQGDWAYEVAEQLATAAQVRYEPKASTRERDAGVHWHTSKVSHATYGDFAGTAEHASNRNGSHRNDHPTVKPIALTRWLASLLLPPAAYAPRRLLIPFAGVASECSGAVLAGWDEVVGIEREQEYVLIGAQRLKYWSQQRTRAHD